MNGLRFSDLQHTVTCKAVSTIVRLKQPAINPLVETNDAQLIYTMQLSTASHSHTAHLIEHLLWYIRGAHAEMPAHLPALQTLSKNISEPVNQMHTNSPSWITV